MRRFHEQISLTCISLTCQCQLFVKILFKKGFAYEEVRKCGEKIAKKNLNVRLPANVLCKMSQFFDRNRWQIVGTVINCTLPNSVVRFSCDFNLNGVNLNINETITGLARVHPWCSRLLGGVELHNS